MRRPIVKRLALAAAVLVVVALAAAGYASYQWSRLVVTVRHEGSTDLPATDIELSARGDHVAVGQLRPGEQVAVTLAPEGESGLELQFVLGEQRCLWGGGYVEPAGGYRVELAIRGCEDVAERTSLWP